MELGLFVKLFYFSYKKTPNPYHNQKFDTRNWKSGMEVCNFLTIYRNTFVAKESKNELKLLALAVKIEKLCSAGVDFKGKIITKPIRLHSQPILETNEKIGLVMIVHFLVEKVT